MSGNRSSRGVLLPSIWQLLVVAVLGGAAFLVWREFSGKAESAPAETPANLVTNMQSVEALVERGSEGVPELIGLLASDDRSVRRLALYGLGRMESQAAAALGPVRKRLDDEDPFVRAAALAAFTNLCTDPADILTTYVRMLTDRDAKIRETVAVFLEGSAPRYYGGLSEPNLTDARPADRIAALDVIGSVFTMAHSERVETRDVVVRIVAALDPQGNNPQVTEVLRSLQDDGDPTVRAAAITKAAARGVAQVDEVRTRLHDADAKVVDAALGAAVWLGPEGEQVIPDVLSLVDTIPDASLVRLVDVLRYHKSSGRPALPGLVRRLVALDPVDDGVREGDWKSMGRPVADDVRRRFAIVTDLLELGGDPHELIGVLKPFIASRRTELAVQMAGLLKRFDPDGARQVAAKLIARIEQDPNHDSESAYVNSLQILSALGPSARDGVPLLIRLVEENDRERLWIAWHAIEALGGIGPEAAPAVPCLKQRLERRKTGWDVEFASLGKIGPAARSTVPAILEALDRFQPPKPDVAKSNKAGSVRPDSLAYQETITALGKMGDDSEAVLSRIRRELAAKTDSLRYLSALEAFLLLSRNAAVVPSELISALHDESASVRSIAACLGEIRGDKTPAISRLIAALDDEDPGVASAAALSLAEIGPAAIGAAPRLRDLAADVRNRAPNRVRLSRDLGGDVRDRTPSWVRRPRDYRPVSFRSPSGDHDLDKLSLAEAARLALGTIEPHP